MNPERLPELLRQRELVRAHLVWLDREIDAATQGAAGPADTAASGTLPGPASVNPPPGLPPAPEFATKLSAATAVDQFQPDPRSAALEARRGCMVALGLALLLLGGVLVAIYLVRYRDRPLLFPTRESSMTEKPLSMSDPAGARK